MYSVNSGILVHQQVYYYLTHGICARIFDSAGLGVQNELRLATVGRQAPIILERSGAR